MNENANENINHINLIEGLLSEVWKHLELIEPNYPRERIAQAQAKEEIDLFMKTTLKDLRTLCEGD